MYSKRDDEKPTSDAVTIGIPAVIVGVLFLCAATILGVIYYRRYKKDKQENLEDAQWDKREDWDVDFNEPQHGNPGNSRLNRHPGLHEDDSSSFELSTLNTWADKPGRRN